MLYYENLKLSCWDCNSTQTICSKIILLENTGAPCNYKIIGEWGGGRTGAPQPPSGEAPELVERAKIVYGNQELLTEELNYISKAVY